MRNLKVFLMIILCSSLTIAQSRHSDKERQFSKKFEELEKIKLIETLNLEEEVVVKFFARRNKLKNDISKLHEEKEKNISQLEDLVQNSKTETDYSFLLDKIYKNEFQLFEIKRKFISSLSELLTQKQIAKFVIFERNFRKDVKNLLIEKGRKKYNQEKNRN
jgi:hypothetical protein